MSYIKKRIVSQKDIAIAAGVSNATVSMALRNDPRITRQTSLRIKQIASTLGYVSDIRMETLMQYVRNKKADQFTETIAYIVNYSEPPDAEGMDYNLLLNSIMTTAGQFSCRLEVFDISDGHPSNSRLNSILVHRGIRAVCVPKINTPDHLLMLDWDRLTSIAIGYSLQIPDIHRVARYHFIGAKSAISKLKEHGYRKIGFVVSPVVNRRNSHQWLAGFISAVQDDEVMSWIPPHIDKLDKTSLRSWLLEYKPDAIMSNSDRVLTHIFHFIIRKFA